MNIKEFATTYCSDIVEKAKRSSDILSLSGFSYDEIIVEEDGTLVKVVNSLNHQIPISDILGMDRDSFAKVWPYPDCLEVYDAYVGSLIILEGEAALYEIRNDLAKEQEKLKLYDAIPEEFRC